VYTTAAEGDGARRHADDGTMGPGRCFKGRATLLKRALEYVSERAFAYTEPEPATTVSAPARLEEILLMDRMFIRGISQRLLVMCCCLFGQGIGTI
jgi:hypothetical protein